MKYLLFLACVLDFVAIAATAFTVGFVFSMTDHLLERFLIVMVFLGCVVVAVSQLLRLKDLICRLNEFDDGVARMGITHTVDGEGI